jgi:hypothetical protein
MRRFLFCLLLALSLITFHTGCKKEKIPDDPMKVKLPLPTQEGLNTFGCLINGVPFVPTRTNSLILYPEKHPLLVTYNLNTKNLIIKALRYNLKENDQWVTTRVWPGSTFDRVGSYNIDNVNYGLIDSSSICGDYKYTKASYFGRLYDVIGGTMNITRFDPDLKIVSGTFDYDVYSKKCGDTVRITQGRFDVKF